MKQQTTEAIVLGRTDYGEADRIISVLTPDHGKLSLMARGVRKQKSKLAGGIELFSTTQISYIVGRGEIHTLTSSRLIKHYGRIVRDIARVQTGYEMIKLLNKATEDSPEAGYYELLEQGFGALNDSEVPLELITTWFQAHLLSLAGHSPNLKTDNEGRVLEADQPYSFDYDSMAFILRPSGQFSSDDIKFLRLIFDGHLPKTLNKIDGIDKLVVSTQPLVRTMLQTHIRI